MCGGFGEVWRATLQEGPGSSVAIIAVKKLRPGGTRKQRIRIAVARASFVSAFLVTDHASQALARELRIWANLDHPNVLSFTGYYLDVNGAVAWLMSPYMENGNIREHLRRSQPDFHTRIALVHDLLKVSATIS